MNRFDGQSWKEDNTVGACHPGKSAEDSRQPPTSQESSENRAQSQSQKEAFAVANVQVISGRKDEEKPNRPVRGPRVVVELDDSSQENCRGDRRKAGNNKGADKIVVTDDIGD
jgi:hypothetical protein